MVVAGQAFHKVIGGSKMKGVLWATVFLLITTSCATSPMVREAREGDIRRVNKLLKKGADINQRNDIGRTPLMEAVSVETIDDNHSQIISLLLSNHADVNIRDDNNYTALTVALIRNHESVVADLIEAGAVVDSSDVIWPLLHGNENVLGMLINAGVDVDSSLLHGALRLGHIRIMQLLVAGGANLNSEDAIGNTVLSNAKKYSPRAIKLLLSLGVERCEWEIVGAEIGGKDDSAQGYVQYCYGQAPKFYDLNKNRICEDAKYFLECFQKVLH